MHKQSALLQTLAQAIISEHYPSLEPLRVAYLMREEAEIRGGKAVAGRTHRATDRDFALHGFDFVVTIAEDVFKEMSPEHQYALLDHFVAFMGVRFEQIGGNWRHQTDPETGRVRSYVREPDVKEFEGVLQRHGAYTAEIRSMLRAFADRKAEERAAAKKTKTEEAPLVEADLSADLDDGPPVVGDADPNRPVVPEIPPMSSAFAETGGG